MKNSIKIDDKEIELPAELIDLIKVQLTTPVKETKEQEMEAFFLECFNGCETKIVPERVGNIFYKKNGKVIMEQDSKSKNFWFDCDSIWSIFKSRFGLNYDGIQAFLKVMLERHLNCGDFTPLQKNQFWKICWKDI